MPTDTDALEASKTYSRYALLPALVLQPHASKDVIRSPHVCSNFTRFSVAALHLGSDSGPTWCQKVRSDKPVARRIRVNVRARVRLACCNKRRMQNAVSCSSSG